MFAPRRQRRAAVEVVARDEPLDVRAERPVRHAERSRYLLVALSACDALENCGLQWRNLRMSCTPSQRRGAAEYS